MDSEETEGEMSIEQYMYRSDGYRQSSPTHPLPHCWKHEKSESDMGWESPQFRILIPDIREILKQHDVDAPFQNCYLHVECLSKPGHPYGNRPTLTLIIKIDQEDDHEPITVQWKPAKDAILSLLRQRGLPHEVELFSTNAASSLAFSLFAQQILSATLTRAIAQFF